MFGIFKKTIPIGEFGLWVFKYSDEFISADAMRSLGSRFPNYDASQGWGPVFESNGVPTPVCGYIRSHAWRTRRELEHSDFGAIHA